MAASAGPESGRRAGSAATGAAAMNVAVLIPAYNPDERLLEVVAGLIAGGVPHLVVVDDGSRPACAPVLDRLLAQPRCQLLRHAFNLGKGRALKTGLNSLLVQHPDYCGVVTADADGQHRPEDILRVARELEEHSDRLVIGCRRFGGRVPLRSRFGNGLTRAIFALLTGRRLSDTQSGLRGIPRGFAVRILGLAGDRYEYEMNMLLAARRCGVEILEVPIDTIYIDDNRSSHFNPLVDSMKIYFLLFRFLFSSLFSALVDFIVFFNLFALSAHLPASIIVARAISGTVNFLINRRVVFKDRHRLAPAFIKFWALLVSRGALSLVLIETLAARFHFRVLLAYLLVEASLFLVSFAIQRDFVFSREEEE
jgi:glycosyltransferase involved in cell wall biosynthesis